MVGIVFLFSSIIFLLQHCRSVIPVLHQNSEGTTVMYEFSDDRIVLTVLLPKMLWLFLHYLKHIVEIK